MSLIFSYLFYNFVLVSAVQSKEAKMMEADSGLELTPESDSNIIETNDLVKLKRKKPKIIKILPRKGKRNVTKAKAKADSDKYCVECQKPFYSKWNLDNHVNR